MKLAILDPKGIAKVAEFLGLNKDDVRTEYEAAKAEDRIYMIDVTNKTDEECRAFMRKIRNQERDYE